MMLKKHKVEYRIVLLGQVSGREEFRVFHRFDVVAAVVVFLKSLGKKSFVRSSVATKKEEAKKES